MKPNFFFLFLIILAAAFAVSIIVLFVSKKMKKKRLSDALGLKLLLVRLPREIKSVEGKTFKDEINLSAQLFSILSGLKTPFSLEAAVHHIGEEIHFYIAAPRDSLASVSRQIEGFFKDARVEAVDDYNIFNPAGVIDAAYIKQKNSHILPLRTYVEANTDTFAPILNGLSKINEVAEGAAIQILAKPAGDDAKKSILKAIKALKKGMTLEEFLNYPKIGFKDIKGALNPEEKNKEQKVVDEEIIKLLEAKLTKPLLEVNLRIVVSAPSAMQAMSILEGISSGFVQFSAPRHQELKIVKPRNNQNFSYQFSFREFDGSQSMILNTEELASMFHLPVSSTETPKVKWLKSKEAAPPENLPSKGTSLGESLFRNERKEIYITDDDRRRHVYIIGQTGTGKSTLLTNMAADDIKAGKGVAVIDPHGDLIEKILTLIPQNRKDDVIVFDPSDIWRPLGLNMLEYDVNNPQEKTFVVNELFSILDKLYNMKEVGGPMFEQYTKNAVLLLMEDAFNEPATLMEIPRVFTDEDFRKKKLSRITNPVVIDFWEKEAIQATGEHSLSGMAPYITSKFNNFTANDYVRPIIGQTKSSFNFRQIMDENKILLVNLSKGKIGDINANLLGMIVVGKILMAALSRVDTPKEKRTDFNLYIDEFQNFSTDSISVILSEARKYHLNLTVAHQFIAQLTEKIRDAIFGNVGSKVVFRIGVQDAEFLAKEFEPVFSQNDLVNIDNFNAYAKILINGVTAKPFNIRTIPSEQGDLLAAHNIKELSRARYGRDKSEVDADILKRLRE